jgi:NADH-quinone oxidoreductase subunit J
MVLAFYIAAGVAVFATVMAITRLNAVHALLYLAISLVAVGVVFYTLGAPFVAALELIIYAGAIMVLFIFVVMMLNLGNRATRMERTLLGRAAWSGPVVLGILLAAEIAYLALRVDPGVRSGAMVDSKRVALALYGPYMLGVELASMLLLAGLVAAYHLGWRRYSELQREMESADAVDTGQRRVDVSRDTVHVGDDRLARTP